MTHFEHESHACVEKLQHIISHPATYTVMLPTPLTTIESCVSKLIFVDFAILAPTMKAFQKRMRQKGRKAEAAIVTTSECGPSRITEPKPISRSSSWHALSTARSGTPDSRRSLSFQDPITIKDHTKHTVAHQGLNTTPESLHAKTNLHVASATPP